MRIFLQQMSEETNEPEREIERDFEMTMMTFLLISDGGLTHSIMVVNRGLLSSPTQSFYPHPLHPRLWDFKNIKDHLLSFTT